MNLLRSLLFVPADSPKKMAKARTVHPDGFIFDLEDSVSADNKTQARALLRRELDTLPKGDATICVRINSCGSGLWKDDLAVAVHPQVAMIGLTKCEDTKDIALIDQAITDLEEKSNIPHGRIQLHLALETTLGVLRSQELARSSVRVAGLGFGAEDYAADLGVSRTYAPDEFLVPRSIVAMTARALRLHAVAGVFTNISDIAGLIEDTKSGMQLGFTTKALIHPAQIAPVHEAFRPSEQEAGWARELVQAFEAAKLQGAGVVAVRGKMVDEPVLLQARRILSYWEALSR
jgi:citrate lyase subunit beta/citryl-CoA lyase